MDGTPIDLEKMRSIGVIGKRTKPTIVEGRAHPDSGRRFKAVTDELNNTVIEHSAAGAAGVSDRQDVIVRPSTVTLKQNVRMGEGTA